MPGELQDRQNVSVLSEAFSTFREASDRLVSTYQGLEEKIAELSRVIREKDRALDSQGQFLDAVLKSLSTGVIVLTTGGRILWSNPLVAEWIGEQESEILGILSDWRVWPVSDSVFQVPVLWKSRSLIVNHSVVQDREGRPAGHVLILTDRTRIREMEEEVARDRRLKEMGEMVATIAHELRNPLGSLEIFASLAQKEVSPETPLSDWVGYMRVQVGRLDRLIGNLLSYTRPPEIVLDRMVMGEFLSRAESDFRRILEMRSRAGDPPILFRVRGDMDAVIEADEALLYQALYNLVTNAFQVLEDGPGGEVVVEGTVSSGGDVCLSVEDNGPGISEAAKEHVCAPFFSTRPKGTGLGLSIVHNIADAHKGSMAFDSRPGRTVFRVRFPSRRDCSRPGKTGRAMREGEL
ncbi:MAG: ATP-binding protein [Nitrospirae bacterium]|jgi:signal transduction histidine kinase|nr:ATP-binding protein [Nitrospirota bacterium]